VNDGSFFIGDVGTAVSGPSTKRLVIDNAGNVGIGTTTPAVGMGVGPNLHVKGANPSIIVEESGTVNSNLVFRRAGSNKWYLLENLGTPADNIAFYDGSISEKVFQINPGGNVGIGTTAPAYKLHVVQTADNRAIWAENNTTSFAAIYGKNAGTGYAGVFVGDVNILGNLTKTSGGFKIDHPLDPAAKFLNHSFVESPDMKNIYDGIVTLDGNGEAWVELPAWFDALNKDFRYQLTAIGAPMPDLYISVEQSGNRFKIAGGTAGMKVSWQITGTRQDAYANANRIQVEEDKAAAIHG